MVQDYGIPPSEVLWSEGFETVLEFLQVLASALPRQTWLLQSSINASWGASAEWITVGFTPDLETNWPVVFQLQV